METKSFGRAIGQEEETEAIMTGESATEAYKKILELANKEDVTTNFDRITESPEALAEFLRSVRCYCDYIHNCKKCPTGCKNGGWLGWLQEKYHE